MAYSTINDPSAYFQTAIYTGTGGSRSVTNDGNSDLQPDWLWVKRRSATNSHHLVNSSMGLSGDVALASDLTNAQFATPVSAFNSDGFSFNAGDASVNANSSTYVAWNWKAGGSAPAITYVVKVVSDSGNKYRFDDFGTSAVTLDLQEGGTYTFDQSDSSNAGHPLRFSTTSDGHHNGGSEYTTGVTTNGTPGQAGAYTRITVAASAPTLYYHCHVHSGMGGQANTNSTFGSSNFSGSIQSTVSANTTAGFSIVSYTGTGANTTIGHGLGAAPRWYIIKNRNRSSNWQVYHEDNGNTHYIKLNGDGAKIDNNEIFNDTSPTSSVFSVGIDQSVNYNGENHIAYVFAEKQGYSKFGSYTGNANADGAFVYTGFSPAFVIIKRTDAVSGWWMADNKRETFNPFDYGILANDSGAELTSSKPIDFLSNGFKSRANTGYHNAAGTYIYMAFAEHPFVASNNIVATAY